MASVMERIRCINVWMLSAFVLLCPSYVRCQYTEGDVRLVGGSSSYEGRVEIYYSGQWGTVCDDSWDNTEASVVCRQLGYSSVGAVARSNAYYGEGSGPIHLDDVRCTGYETRLTYCGSNGWGIENCGHHEDAGVSCSYEYTEGDVRLVGGSSSYEGRVEIYYSGQWGTVCDDSWDNTDASVVCRQLGYSSVGAVARPRAYYGQGSGPIHLDDVRCTGYETRLTSCGSSGWGIENCGHSEDAGVSCSEYTEGDIRLVAGTTSYEGRVEIYYSDQWGTVCDDSWDNTDARVVCRQLGYSSVGAVARSNAYYGEGSGPIHLDDVDCTGYETRLTSCGSNGWGIENCGHSEDAGVSCSEYTEGDIRLVGGTTSYEGRVEIYYSGQWGTVCDDSWDNTDASVVCRQLGYSSVGAVARSMAYYGEGSGPIHLDDVDCTGYESRLTSCGSNGWGIENCVHSEDAGVSCSEYTEGDIRLVAGTTSYEGRVEIYYSGQWGTVCDDSWDNTDARVVCRQLGYSNVGAVARSNAYYGEGSGPIHLDDVDCAGSETRLTSCGSNGWGIENCEHSEDAGVYCSEYTEGDIRLVGGSTSYEGRVEIYYSGQWGTVCDDSWDNTDARVVCRQLGYPSVGAVAWSNAYYGEGSGPIHLDDVRCTGYETRLTSCGSNGWGIENCGHYEDAGVSCSDLYSTTQSWSTPEGTVRLVDGSTPNQGRVEIFHNGQWGTVCDDRWDGPDARVVCRQLGYNDDFADARSNAYYGAGSGPIHLDEVRCGGYESELTYCTDDGWGVHDCTHSEDAGVFCYEHQVPPKFVGMITFISVSLFLLTSVAIIAICYTCNSSKSAARTSPTEPFPLRTGPGHLAAYITSAAPTTTYPSDHMQPSMQPPSQLPANAYPPAADSNPSSAPPAYVSIVESSNPLLPPN